MDGCDFILVDGGCMFKTSKVFVIIDCCAFLNVAIVLIDVFFFLCSGFVLSL